MIPATKLSAQAEWSTLPSVANVVSGNAVDVGTLWNLLSAGASCRLKMLMDRMIGHPEYSPDILRQLEYLDLDEQLIYVASNQGIEGLTA